MVMWSEGSTDHSAALWNHRVLPGIKDIQEQFSLGNIYWFVRLMGILSTILSLIVQPFGPHHCLGGTGGLQKLRTVDKKIRVACH